MDSPIAEKEEAFARMSSEMKNQNLNPKKYYNWDDIARRLLEKYERSLVGDFLLQKFKKLDPSENPMFMYASTIKDLFPEQKSALAQVLFDQLRNDKCNSSDILSLTGFVLENNPSEAPAIAEFLISEFTNHLSRKDYSRRIAISMIHQADPIQGLGKLAKVLLKKLLETRDVSFFTETILEHIAPSLSPVEKKKLAVSDEAMTFLIWAAEPEQASKEPVQNLHNYIQSIMRD